MSNRDGATQDPAELAVVVLSQGDRPTELARCLASVLAQQNVAVDVVVVGNGWTPQGLDPQVRCHSLATNLGAPAGRNIGAELTNAELVLFLDDDAWLPEPGTLRGVIDRFAGDRRLGAVQLRVVGDDGRTMRRWVPRARVGDPARSGPAFSLAEGVTVVRRRAFDEVGGWSGAFFYGHEGIDLTWRLWDADWVVQYEADLRARHPTTVDSRHAEFFRYNARNRVWVARRNLPAPLLVQYLLTWAVITHVRHARDPAALGAWWRGFAEGWQTRCGPRRPMRWRTVTRLTRLGQPPIV